MQTFLYNPVITFPDIHSFVFLIVQIVVTWLLWDPAQSVNDHKNDGTLIRLHEENVL